MCVFVCVCVGKRIVDTLYSLLHTRSKIFVTLTHMVVVSVHFFPIYTQIVGNRFHHLYVVCANIRRQYGAVLLFIHYPNYRIFAENNTQDALI